MTRTIRHILTCLAPVLAGAGLVVSGVVLLLRALWLVLALPLGPIWASTVLGGGLVLIGALVLALTTRQRRHSAQPERDLIVRIVNAFLEGLAAGRSGSDR